jgi:protease I
MADLSNTHVACLVTEGFEQAELVEPVKALRDAGAVVDILSQKRGPGRSIKHHDPAEPVNADLGFDEAQPDRYDALLLPGGALNADAIRMIPKAQQFVRAFDSAKKPMAVICHAPWLLVSSGVARGRKLTSFETIQDDMKNAGANWVDQEVVVDGNVVTSRKPDDIPAFNREFLTLIEKNKTDRSATSAQSGQTARV